MRRIKYLKNSKKEAERALRTVCVLGHYYNIVGEQLKKYYKVICFYWKKKR